MVLVICSWRWEIVSKFHINTGGTEEAAGHTLQAAFGWLSHSVRQSLVSTNFLRYALFLKNFTAVISAISSGKRPNWFLDRDTVHESIFQKTFARASIERVGFFDKMIGIGSEMRGFFLFPVRGRALRNEGNVSGKSH